MHSATADVNHSFLAVCSYSVVVNLHGPNSVQKLNSAPTTPCRLPPARSILFRVLHAHDLVGDSVDDMLVLLTSDAFQPPEPNDSGATAASFSST